MNRTWLITTLLLMAMVMPGSVALAQGQDRCVALVIETAEDLGRPLDEMGIAYRRVTFDDLRDEALLARLCVVFIGHGLPTGSEVAAPLARWVQRGGGLYLAGEARLLLMDIVGPLITFEAAGQTPLGDLEAQVVEPGLAMVTGARVRLRYESAHGPLMARADGQVLLRARVRTGSSDRTVPLAVQFTRGNGTVLYSTLVGYNQRSSSEQSLMRALMLRVLTARRAQELSRPALPGAVLQLATLAEPNSTQVFQYPVLAGQDFDVVLDNPDKRLALSLVSPVTTTAILTPQEGVGWSSVEVRAPVAGTWRIQVRPASSSSQSQPYLLLIIPRVGTNLLNTLPTPLRVSTRLPVAGTNLALALLLTVLLGLSAFLLNDRPPRTQKVEPSRARQIVGNVGRRIGQAYHVIGSPTTWNIAPVLRRVVITLALATGFALGALLAAMLDRYFAPTTLRGAGVLVGLFIAIGLTSLAFVGGQKWMARILKESSALRLRPMGVLMAALLALLSRLLNLLPGFMYALPVGLTFSGEADPSARRRLALSALAGVMAVLLVGLIFWGLSIPTDWALRQLNYGAGEGLGATGAILLSALQTLFLLIFFIALQLAFFELLPVGALAGGYLFRWRGGVWGILSLVVSALMFHTLLNPTGDLLALTGNRNVLALAVGLAFYTIVALAVWLVWYGAGLTGKGAIPPRRVLVAVVLVMALWGAACACGALTAAWRTLAVR